MPVVERLRELIGFPELPLEADNEGTLAALGELCDLRGAGLRDFIYVSGDVGVGAGLPDVVASRLGHEAAVRGAAAAPVRRMLAAPRAAQPA